MKEKLMEEDEELYREMNEEDDFYMGKKSSTDHAAPQEPQPNENRWHRLNNSTTWGCVLMIVVDAIIACAILFG